MTRAQAEERDRSIGILREMLKPGDTVSTILRYVSRSGMSRSISLVVCRDGRAEDISYYAARAMDDKIDGKNGGIKIGGCGMDMGFALVYSLSRTLFPVFPCTGNDGRGSKRGNCCPSNDHSSEREENYRRGRKHSDGGYALRQVWL